MKKKFLFKLLLLLIYVSSLVCMEKQSPRFDRKSLISDVENLNQALLQLISIRSAHNSEPKPLTKSISRRSLCETKDEIYDSALGAGTSSENDARKILEDSSQDQSKEQEVLNRYLTAFNMYTKAYHQNNGLDVLESIYSTVLQILTIAQLQDEKEIPCGYLCPKLLYLKSQITFLINKERDKHERRLSEPQFDRINNKLQDAQIILKKLRIETEKTEREIKSSPELHLRIDLIKETNLERIRSCNAVLSSLFLIYHEINQSEDAYKAMEEALDIVLINNIQISKITPHEWNNEPKFKKTLALIRKIRTELDDKAVKAKQRATELKQQTAAVANESHLLTWDQALVESLHATGSREKVDTEFPIPEQKNDSEASSKQSFKQKILDKLHLKKQ